LSELVQLDN